MTLKPHVLINTFQVKRIRTVHNEVRSILIDIINPGIWDKMKLYSVHTQLKHSDYPEMDINKDISIGQSEIS